MIGTSFLIPIRDNEGRPFLPSQWRALHQRLLVEFGGYTRVSNVQGAWEDRGRVYRDRNRQYLVSLESWTQLPAWLDLVRWARQTFRQEAIHVEVAGVPEILRNVSG
ncbi:MAG: hypothetical protein H0V51_18425 [Chloroflexi bacterium]|nr:hypothetical protein [Chloroflexota bacterium]